MIYNDFRDPFSIVFVRPHFGTPPLKSFLTHLGAPGCRASLAMSILIRFGEPPGVQNGTLERPGRLEMSKRDVTFSRGGGPGAVLFRPRRALRSKWVPEATLVDFGTPLGHLGRHLTPTGGPKARFPKEFWPLVTRF